MFNGRFPFGRSYGSNDPAPAVVGGQRGSIYGVPDVRFNEDGRPFVPGNERQQPPTNMLLWRQSPAVGAQPPPDPINWRYRPWSSTPVQQDVYAPRAPIITRRFDRELPYVTTGMVGGAAQGPAVTSSTTKMRTTMTPETIVIEEMKIYDQKPCAWWLFVIVGLLMIVLGIMNIMWCWDNQYYCRFWTGVFLILIGIIGAIHRGNYVTKYKSWLYIVVGMITTAAVLVSSFLLLRSFIHQLIELAQWQVPEYIYTMEQRYSLLGINPMRNLTNWDYNIWVCFALDAIDIVLLILGFIVHASVLQVIDRFFNSHYAITRKVEPFCEPWLFNPWGQSSLGQAIIFIGFVLNGIPYGTFQTAFQNTYAGIWGGVLPLFAGILAALALKSCDKKRRLLNLLALLLELGSIVVSVVAIIFITLGISDNITTINQGQVMIITDFPRIMMVVSSFAFAIADMAAIVNVFYSLSLLIRLLYCFCTNCCGKDLTKTQAEHTVEETKYLDADKVVTRTSGPTPPLPPQEVSYPYSRPFIRRNNVMPAFDPYRPAGGRSFYMQ
jgi:hypothetical protein